MRRLLWLAPLAFAAPALARELNAQGVLLGERAAGMGGAFVSLTGDGTSSYYNPAGVAALHAKGISLSASAYQLNRETYPKLLEVDVGAGATLTSDMKSTSIATFPSSIVYVLPLDKDPDPATLHRVLTFSILIPQHDKLAAKLTTAQDAWAFDLTGTYRNQDVTYWVGPSYGFQVNGALRVGASLFALAHLTDSDSKLGSKLTFAGASGASSLYVASAVERTGTAATALAQLGLQWDVTDRFTIGVTVRTPTFGRLYSSASMVEIDSLYQENAALAPVSGYVDRIEIGEGLTVDYRRPLFLAAGMSYHVKDEFAVALDGSVHGELKRYKAFDGDLAYPTDPSGNPILDPDRAVDPVEWVQAKQVANANLGVEVNFGPKLLGRLGAFTDFSVVDRKRDPELTHPELTRLGLSLGIGRIGERSTTSFGLVYVKGSGTAPGANEAFGEPANEVKVTSHTLTVVLSGSADL
jgi:hypothetical protein